MNDKMTPDEINEEELKQAEERVKKLINAYFKLSAEIETRKKLKKVSNNQDDHFSFKTLKEINFLISVYMKKYSIKDKRFDALVEEINILEEALAAEDKEKFAYHKKLYKETANLLIEQINKQSGKTVIPAL